MKHYKLMIIGAGASGIGFGVALKRLKIDDFLIVEKGFIGDSFLKWPKTTHFITPSFTSNGFGFPDLNAIAPDTSPAFSFEKEHLSGKEYAEYLQMVAAHYQLPISLNTKVSQIQKENGRFIITSDRESYSSDYLIMACGEFQLPNKSNIEGAELAMHYGEIESFHVKSEDPFIVIGGNESGCDALTHLAYLGNEVHLFTDRFGDKETNPDPSISLSPITKERLKHIRENKAYKVHIHEKKKVKKIEKVKDAYQLSFEDGSYAKTKHKPILATGFLNSSRLISGSPLFDYDANGLPQVTPDDESTLMENCFLIGPSLRQEDTIFCYIYKFRQRFVPIICHIAEREKIALDQDEIDFYKANQMFLEDLSCCQVNCDC
ncbi:NAD(P)/FAD-dependent oxidoreductase [Streptococcus catagoni]|uniref:NAD(P)/FAD-dependent oxidoreductase n=1 Tax=Streptococcus catagoni TaxID=2654874 RepID=UPI00140C48CB|nr:NAD(P)/FAD-dependent oxidoreductase [Streptococcus catagoni]